MVVSSPLKYSQNSRYVSTENLSPQLLFIYKRNECFHFFSIHSTQTYVDDCYDNNSCTSASDKWVIIDSSDVSYSFSDNGITVSGEGGLKYDITYPTDYSVEFTVVGYSAYGGAIVEPVCEGWAIQGYGSSYVFDVSDWNTRQYCGGGINANDVIKYVVEGSNVAIYKNGTLMISKTSRLDHMQGFNFRPIYRRGITVKDLKIRSL